MPKTQLTKRVVESLEFATDKPVFYRDKTLCGLALKVSRTTKTFVVEGQVNRRTRRVTLGRADVLTPEVARKRARGVLADMADGVDPTQAKREAAAEQIGVETAFEYFLKAKPHLAASTVDCYRRTCRLYLGCWRQLPIAGITRQMVLERHRKISDESGASTANSVMRHFRSIYNFTAAGFDQFPANPVAILTQARAWNRERRRQSVVPAHLLRDWWVAVMQEDDTSRDILLVTLFTGMRRNEVLSLAWDHVDLLGRTLTVPDTKNGDPLTLPLSNYLAELLKRRRRSTGNAAFVFPSKSATGHIREPKKIMQRVSAAISHKFTMHDLRRTYVSIAESLDIPHYALKRLLNHRTDGDVTGGYIVIDPERLREPVERVAARILELAYGEQKAATDTYSRRRKIF